ncbi:MAG: ATP synthase F1 subunit gamma [bacterium]|nr:ATP synthase F1 subunit gamma [bacterium]
MAKTQDLKRRIRSVKNTMQLTRAMKMVSAAKLRRSQEAMMRARPYSRQMLKVLRSLAARANTEDNPLLQEHGDQRVEVILMTSDRGLCGSFNAGLVRQAETLLHKLRDRDLSMAAVGKKGREYFARRNANIVHEWLDVFRVVEFATAEEIARTMIDLYLKKEVDQVYLVYNEFKSAIQSTPTIQRLLPIEPAELASGEEAQDYIYEPEQQTLFDSLLPHYVEQSVYHAMLESVAAEHAARMSAMDAATSNAGELIESLTLTMNRVRQAAITTEIIEVVSGAEALG